MFRKWIDSHPDDEMLHDNSTVSVHDWIAVMTVMIIPVVNIVMLVYWAFADKSLTPVSKINWARATLIVLTISIITVVCVAALFCMCYFFNDVMLAKII